MQEQEKDDSVFDFIYVDRARLGSMLAQLSDDGIVTVAKRTSSHTGTNTGKVKLDAKLVSADGGVSDAATEALERSFDASWLLPINALTVIQESGLLHDDLGPPLGSLVHVSGRVAVYDFELVRRLWDPITKLMVAAEPPAKQKAKRGEADIAGAIIRELPGTVQLSMETEHGEIWALLTDIDPAFNTHFLGLKHGSTLQGEWHLIGILDAQPDLPGMNFPVGSSGLLPMIAPMIDQFRQILGRPATAYGVTPLAIFRSVNPA